MDISQLVEIIPGIIIFRISSVEFCINIKDVQLIKRTEEFELLQNGGSIGTSQVMIHNINVPLIDISEKFNLSFEKSFDQRMILLVKHHSEEDNLEKTFGLIVDEVIELVITERNDDNHLLKFIPKGDNPFISGSIFIENREILLPNYLKIASVSVLNNSV